MKLEETAGWANDCISTFSCDVTFANCYGYVRLRNLGLYKRMSLQLVWDKFHFLVRLQLFINLAYLLFVLKFVQLRETPFGDG